MEALRRGVRACGASGYSEQSDQLDWSALGGIVSDLFSGALGSSALGGSTLGSGALGGSTKGSRRGKKN